MTKFEIQNKSKTPNVKIQNQGFVIWYLSFKFILNFGL